MEVQQISNSATSGFQSAVKPASDVKSQPAGEVLNPTTAAVAAAPAHAVQQAVAVPSAEEVKRSVEIINKTIHTMNSNLQFSVDEDTKKNVVKVVDMETKDVIRQMPSQEVLAIAKALDKLQGLLVREKA